MALVDVKVIFDSGMPMDAHLQEQVLKACSYLRA